VLHRSLASRRILWRRARAIARTLAESWRQDSCQIRARDGKESAASCGACQMKTSTFEDIAIAVVSFALAYHAYLIIAALAK